MNEDQKLVNLSPNELLLLTLVVNDLKQQSVEFGRRVKAVEDLMAQYEESALRYQDDGK